MSKCQSLYSYTPELEVSTAEQIKSLAAGRRAPGYGGLSGRMVRGSNTLPNARWAVRRTPETRSTRDHTAYGALDVLLERCHYGANSIALLRTLGGVATLDAAGVFRGPARYNSMSGGTMLERCD